MCWERNSPSAVVNTMDSLVVRSFPSWNSGGLRVVASWSQAWVWIWRLPSGCANGHKVLEVVRRDLRWGIASWTCGIPPCSISVDLAGSQHLVRLSRSLHEPPELASEGLVCRAVPAWCGPRSGCYSSSIWGSPWSLLSHAGDISAGCTLSGLEELKVWALAEIIPHHGPLAWLSLPDALVSSL